MLTMLIDMIGRATDMTGDMLPPVCLEVPSISDYTVKTGIKEAIRAVIS